MKFDNAFITKSGFVGMQFKAKNKEILSVWYDGATVHFTEGFSKKDTEAAVSYYNKNYTNFIRN